MSRYIFICLLVLASMCTFAQSKDELEIRQLLDQQTKAWNRGDLEEFMSGYWKSDSLMFIGKSGVTYGWKNTLENYKKGYPDKTAMGELVFDLVLVERISPEYFHVVGKWLLKRSIGDVQGYYTLLLKRIGGKWVIVADHSS